MEPTSSESLAPDDISHQIKHRSCRDLIPRMKLSIEATVAAAVAVAFAVLSMAVIVQEHGERGSGKATGYSPTTSAVLSYASLR
jgi:hypothetical protein